MAKALPPLNWFRAFEASARRLSFTAAAEEIGMTQSAVSQQVKSLELRLGVPLFLRKARGLALTDDGRRLLPQVDSALQTLAGATDGYKSANARNLVTVSTSVSVLEWVIAPALAAFQKAHPDIALRFISAVWPDEFSRTQADVEIRFGSRVQAGASAILLGGDRLLALKGTHASDAFSTLPVIETVGISDGWQAWEKQEGVTITTTKTFVDSYGVALTLARNGAGVCLVNALLGQHAMQAGTVVKAHEGTIIANEGYYLSVMRDTPASQVFANWITELAAQS
jgi:LysR family glycine cleavage system transcriptional activator